MKLATCLVKLKKGGKVCRINEDDFDPNLHKHTDEEPEVFATGAVSGVEGVRVPEPGEGQAGGGAEAGAEGIPEAPPEMPLGGVPSVPSYTAAVLASMNKADLLKAADSRDVAARKHWTNAAIAKAILADQE